MIPAGMALGIYDNVGVVNRAMGSIYSTMQARAYNLSTNVAGSMAMQPVAVAAGAGGGSTTTNETTINVYVTAAPGATQEDGQNIGIGITKALRSRGLA